MGTAVIAVIKPQETTDAALVEAVREGDDAAFGELYRRHQPEIGRFVRGRVRDRGRAEDVTQEAFVSALRRLRKTEGDVAFRPWIFEIARNATIDSYRRTSRSEEVSIDAGGLAASDAGRMPPGLQPDAQAATHERLEYLRGALDELSETHHRVIVMRELEGRSYREIGARMNLSQSAVESTLFRARRRLEHEYEELDTGRRCRLVGAATARLAEGLESTRDRRRLGRHALRCSSCRRRAREMGVEPMLGRGIAAKAAALLPLPAFLRRRLEDAPVAAGDTVGHSTGLIVGPGLEAASGPAAKAVALIVTAVFVGGGGATLGGIGPLALAPEPPAPAAEQPASAGGERDIRPARGPGDVAGPRSARRGAPPSLDRLLEGGAARQRVEPSAARTAPPLGAGPAGTDPGPASPPPGASAPPSAVKPEPAAPPPQPPISTLPAPPAPPQTPPPGPSPAALSPAGAPVVTAPPAASAAPLETAVTSALGENL